MSNIRVAPGESAVQNSSTQGLFVILVSDKTGTPIKTSYLTGSSLLLSSKEINTSGLPNYLDVLTVPEAYTNTFKLLDKVLIIGVSWSRTFIESFIITKESRFYVSWNTVQAVTVGEEILLPPDDLLELCRPLIGYCLEQKDKWLGDITDKGIVGPELLKLGARTKDSPSVEFGDKEFVVDELEDELVDEDEYEGIHGLRELITVYLLDFINKLGYQLHEKLPTPDPIIDGFIVETVDLIQNHVSREQLDKLKSSIVDCPNECHLVHLSQFQSNIAPALQYLIGDETRDTVLKNPLIDTNSLYLFSLSEVYVDGINMYETTVQKIDEYCKFPIQELFTQGVLTHQTLITGSIIPACCHDITRRDYLLDIYTRKSKYNTIDRYYPPFYSMNGHLGNLEITEIELIDPETIELTYTENARSSSEKRIPEKARINVFPGAGITVLVDSSLDYSLVASKTLKIMSKYFPSARLVETEKNGEVVHVIKGVYRTMKFKRGGILQVLNHRVAMTRGFITQNKSNDKSNGEGLDIVLSASCIQSAITKKTNNLYILANGYSQNTVSKWKYRGYKLPRNFAAYKNYNIQKFLSNEKNFTENVFSDPPLVEYRKDIMHLL